MDFTDIITLLTLFLSPSESIEKNSMLAIPHRTLEKLHNSKPESVVAFRKHYESSKWNYNFEIVE